MSKKTDFDRGKMKQIIEKGMVERHQVIRTDHPLQVIRKICGGFQREKKNSFLFEEKKQFQKKNGLRLKLIVDRLVLVCERVCVGLKLSCEVVTEVKKLEAGFFLFEEKKDSRRKKKVGLRGLGCVPGWGL